MNIENTRDEARKGITILVYGDSGVGKTSLAKTLPDLLLIDVEGGTATLAGHAVDVVRINSNLDNLAEAFDGLDTLEGYQTVMLDSATELEKYMLIRLAQKTKNGGMPSIQDYGIVSFKMRDYMRRLRDLRERGVNVVVTALEMPLELEQDEGVIRTRAYPMMGRRLAPEICGLFDVVGHMEVSSKKGHEGERFIRLQPTERIVAKNRYGAEQWTAPDLGELIAGIHGSKGE